MLGFLKKLFGEKSTVLPVPEVPYKVETPTLEKATEVMVESVAAPLPTKKTASKKPVPKKTSAPKNKSKPKSKVQPK